MPAIDPGSRNTNATKPRKVRVTAKAAPPAKPAKARPVKVTVPDAGEATRTRTVARMTPDQADRERTPAQKTKDAAAVKTNVRVSREKAVAKAGRGSGTRAVKKVLKGIANADLTSTANTGAGPTVHTVGIGSGGVHFAAMEPVSRNLTVDDTTAAGSFIRNATSDAGELLVTTPSSLAHLGATAVTHPKKVPGILAKPYIDFAKHPVHSFTERPISTALMLAPGVRMPGRVVGKVARVTGKQTLERPAATLPHTALKETRTGSRDFTVRVMQSRKDAKGPAPTVTAKQVQQRVDHHYDASKQESHRTIGEAVKAADKATKGQPKDARAAAIDAAREKAQQAATAVAEERFAREFGANERLSHGVAAREATHTVRRQAVKVLDAAKATAKQAEDAHKAAWNDLRGARNSARSSAQLKALEFQRRDAQRDLGDAQRAHTEARIAHERALANARVSAATPKTTVRARVLARDRQAASKVEGVTAPEAPTLVTPKLPLPHKVTAARSAVRAADRRVNALHREMRRAEEKASQLEGVTVGRYAGKKMTEGAGKRVADHAQYMGELRDEITSAERAAATARGDLKAAEGEHRGAQRQADIAAKGEHRAVIAGQRATVRVAQRDAAQTAKARARAVDRQIAAERARVSGVAPAQHQALLDAIDNLANAPGRVTEARQRIRDIEKQIADEHARPLPPLHPARQAFTSAIQARGQARATLATARADAQVAAHAHIDAKRAMTNSTLVQPAGEGRLFAHKADAATVVKKLNQTGDPTTFVLRQVGEDRWAAVPKVAAERLTKHHVVGTSPATMAKVMRVSRGAFTNAVLPLSPKWLAGQGVEAGIRSAVAGAGPMDWLRMGKVVKELNKKSPGAGDQLATRISGGQFGLTGPARDFANGKSLADEFADTSLEKGAKAASAVGRTLPARAVKEGWKQYTRVVLDGINHTIESNARRAMAGQAIKNLGIQDSHLLGLTGKAIDDAANGLKGTHTQVALARAVDRMYGQYQKFSAEKRSLLLHWTPFLPWYLNTAKFLFRVLPMDHPVITALIADANMAEEEWRKSHGLSFHAPHVPFYMMGSYPTKDGKYLNIAHYTPWGVGADPVGATADLALPQILGPIKNMGGVDWKWQRLTHGGKHGPEFNWGEKLARAGVTALEEQIPGVSQVGKVSGLTPRYVDKDNPDDIKGPGEAAKGYLPWTPMSNNQPTTGGSGGASSSSGRVKVPGASGARIKIPGVTGRIKIP